MSAPMGDRAIPARRCGAVVVVTLVLLAFSGSAGAHQMFAGAGFAAGFGHPWLGADHVLAMLAVGLYAAQARATTLRWTLPLAFVLSSALALAAARAGGSWPGVEGAILVSLLVLGLLVGLRLALAPGVALGLVALSGMLHGHAHGLEVLPGTNAWLFGLGMVLATALLHTCGVALALSLRARGAWPWRVAGAGIFAFGLGAAVL